MSTLAPCPVMSIIKNDEGFKRLQEIYTMPGTDRKVPDILMGVILQQYRMKNALAPDFYPSTDDEMKHFSSFFKSCFKPENTREYITQKYEAVSGLYATPKQLEDRVNMIAWDFRTKVDEIGGTGLSRAEIIKNAGDGKKNGFTVIMDKVFDMYQNDPAFTYQGMMDAWKSEHPDATEDELLELEADIRYTLDEYKKVIDNKDMFVQFAAVKIGAAEGFVVDLNDNGIELEEIKDAMEQAEEHRESSSEDEDGTDVSENSKGERYADFRVLRLMESLSPRARRYISNIPKRNSAGEIVYDDLSVPQFLEGRQVAIVLNRILVDTDSYNMMDTLRSAIPQYPWLSSLVSALNEDIDAQALIYNSFKKAETRYSYVTIENGRYAVKFGNTRARNNSLAREVGTNVSSGFVLQEEYSIYNSLGRLVSDEKVEEIRAKDKDVLDKLKEASGVNMLIDAKESEGQPQNPEEAVREMLEKNRDAVEVLAKKLRGIGIPVSADEIIEVSSQRLTAKSQMLITGQSKAGLNGEGPRFGNRLATILIGLNYVYDRVKFSNKRMKSYGEYLWAVSSLEYLPICRALNLAKYDEVESRFVDESRSLSTYNNVNLLHQTFDKLANKEGLSEDEYQIMLERDFLQYEGMANGKDCIPHGWLERFKDYPVFRDNFEVIDLPTFNHVEYSKLSEAQKLTSSFVMYFSRIESGDYPAYEYPIQSDYSSAYNFIVAPSYTLNEVIDNLAYEVEAEYERMVAIQERLDNDPDEKDKSLEPIRAKSKIYEKGGLKFQIFPGLNNTDIKERYKNADSPALKHAVMVDAVRKQLIAVVQKDIAKINSTGILNNTLFERQGFYTEDGRVESLEQEKQEEITEFCANVFYARQQASKLVTGDLAWFDGIVDYEKRNMMTHATRTSPYLPAGREYQRAMYIEDDKAESAFKSNIAALIHELRTSKVITADMEKDMISAYSSITTTDGQAYRTMESYRDVKKMLAQWSPEEEEAYQNIKSGKPSPNDIRTIFQNLKPVYTGYETIPAQNGEFQKPLRIPVLHKYSEAVLLPTFLAKHCLQADSAPMRAFSELSDRLSGVVKSKTGDVKFLEKLVQIKEKDLAYAMERRRKAELAATQERRERYKRTAERLIRVAQDELFTAKKRLAAASTPVALENPVDIFLFHSCVKVGYHSGLQPFARVGKADSERLLTNPTDMADYMVSKVNSGDFYIHVLPMRYYGIAASTIPHTADDSIAPATQAEKMIFANVQKGDIVYRDGKEVDAVENRDDFYKVKTAKIVKQYETVRDIIGDERQLSRILQKEIADKPYNSRELRYALSLLSDGSFATHFFSPNVSHNVENLLLSIIKKRLTKIPQKGANILQASSFGMDADIHEFDEGRLGDSWGKLGINFNDEEIRSGKEHDRRIKSFDVYMTCHDSRLLRFCEKDGSLSSEKLEKLIKDGVIPESILEFVCYRTPSDAEHSIIPCRIKGFLPRTGGVSIYLPKEAMVITGCDFDGDKMRCFMKDFNMKGVDETTSSLEAVQMILGQTSIDKVEEIKYDYSKSPIEQIGKNNDYRALNNAQVEIMFSQISSPAGSARMMIPGGCEETKVLARTIDIIRASKTPESKEIIRNALVEYLGLTDHQATERVKNVNELYNTLKRAEDWQLSKIQSAVKGADSPYSLAHSVEAFEYIMGGAEMISIYAMYSSAQAMFRRANLSYVPEERVGRNNDTYTIPVSLFGSPIDKLYSIKNNQGILASLGLARLVNAAVDNNKAPVLGLINQRPELAELTNFLFAAGLSEEQIHLIYCQPIMLEFAKRLKAPGAGTFSSEVSNFLSEYDKRLNLPAEINGRGMQYGAVWATRLMAGVTEDMLVEPLPMSMEDVCGQDVELKLRQVALLKTLGHISAAADELAEIVKLTRPESDSGSIGSELSKAITKKISLDQFRDRDSYHIKGAYELIRKIDADKLNPNASADDIYADISQETLPEVAVLNNVEFDNLDNVLGKYFPQLHPTWERVIRQVLDMYSFKSVQSGAVSRIVNDMILWKIMQNKELIPGDVTAEQKEIIKNVPERLIKLRKRIAEAVKNPGSDPVAEVLQDNPFLTRLEVFSPEFALNGVRRLRFTLNGPAVQDIGDMIRGGWAQMMLFDDSELRQLAIDLYKYNLFTNGFSYGMYEFFHFAPFNVVMKCPGYREALDAVLKSDWTADLDTDRFIDQYCMNHWADKKFLYELDPNKDAEEYFPILSESSDRFVVAKVKRGKKTTQELLHVDRDAEGKAIGFTPAPKLSIVSRGNQITRQYNPSVDWKDITPILTAQETSREEKTRLNIDQKGNINAPNNNPVTPDDIILSMFGPAAASKSVENIKEKAEIATDKDDGKIPDDIPAPTEEDTPAPTQGEPVEISFEDMQKQFPGLMFHLIEQNEKGEIVEVKAPATPYNVRRARRQRAFVELNRRLREIMAEKGIGEGALTDAEARLGISGVSVFDTPRVLANGMIEMIRLANGYEGEAALPEEFAHVALAMLGDDTLAKRLYDAIDRNEDVLKDALGENYAEYVRTYNNDRDALVKEAAGKLVAKQMLLHQELEQKTKSKVYSILRRVIGAIKDFFRKFTTREFQNAIYEADGIASELAKGLLSGRLVDEMELSNIVKSSPLYNKVQVDITDKQDILSRLIKNVAKRLEVLKVRQGRAADENSTLITQTQAQVDSLLNAQLNYKTEDAVLGYMSSTLSYLGSLDESLRKVADERNGVPVNTLCKNVMAIKDTLAGFSQDLVNIREAIRDKEIVDNVDIDETINTVEGELAKLFSKCEDLQRAYFENMLADVYGKEGVTVEIGKHKGRTITIREMASRLDKDVSLVDRWFYSLADCNDYVLQAIDEIVREAKYRGIRRAGNIRPRIEAAMNSLMRETGSRDQSFMFKYGVVNGKRVRTGEYLSKEESLSLSPAQKKFYDTMMEIKREADACVPEQLTKPLKIVMLRKSTVDKFKDAEGAGGKALSAWESLKNRVYDTSKNADPEYENVTLDFENNKIDYLPVKFLFKGEGESFDDMTEDVATSIMAYAGMAFEYNEMNGIIGIIENARYMAGKRDIVQTTNGRTKSEKIENESVSFRTPFTVKGARSKAQQVLDDFFQMHVYGHLQKAEGNFGNTKISKRKVVDFINMITSYSQMAINLPQRIANLSTGASQIIIETRGKGVFNSKDFLWASKEWVKHSANRLAQTGKTDYDDKLALFMDHFDVHQDNGRVNPKYAKKRGSKVFNTSLLYAGLQTGEDYLAGVTALARAKNTKLRDANGKETNLWDAYEVKYVDEANKSGAYLALKSGITMPDGSAITLDDEHRFAKAVAGLNFRLQGIYNLNDRSAVQQYAAGALVIMYRKWIAPALKRRYGATRYSHLEEQWEEGYYRTYGRAIWKTYKDALAEVTEDQSMWALLNIINDVRAYASAWRVNKENMTAYEKSNIKRAFTDISLVAGLFLATSLLLRLPPDDHDGDKALTWLDNMMLSQLLRLRVELGSQAPTPLMISEAAKILKSPFAAAGPMVETLNIFQLMLPWNYATEVKSGRYKGHSKAYKYFREFPVISMFKRIDNFVDPAPQLRYYQNESVW